MTLDEALRTGNSAGSSAINRTGTSPIRVLRDVGGPGLTVYEVDDRDPTMGTLKTLFVGSSVDEVQEFLNQQRYSLDADGWYPG